jgi:polysaccharide export outer membrane protein
MKIFYSAFAIFFIIAAFIVPDIHPQDSEYKLQPSDVLNITVHGQPDLTTKTRVTKDGYITFPLLGKVKAQGLAVRELEQELKTLLEKNYLVNAQVLVFIENYNSRQVSVMGEVQKPGKYDIPPEKELTLMGAIATAEGFTKDAEVTRVRVMRNQGGQKKTMVINTKDITDKGDKDKDIPLDPDDIVYVPESFF